MERGAHGEDHILVVSVIQAQQHQVPHVTPDGRHRCHHFIAAQRERPSGYSPLAYTWRQGRHHFIAEQRETFRLFISCLHLMTSSAERSPGYSSVAYTWWQVDHGFIEADSDHWVSHHSPLSVQLEVMCLSNYSTSFKAKRLTLWMPTDQQSVRHNWCVRFQFLCWLYHLKDNWIISLKKGWSVPSLLVRSTAL